MLDIYDLVYEQVVKNPSGTRQRELQAIQDTVSMPGAASLSPGGSRPLSLPTCPVIRKIGAGWSPESAGQRQALSRGHQDTGRRRPCWGRWGTKRSCPTPSALDRAGHRVCGAQSQMKRPLSKNDEELLDALGAALSRAPVMAGAAAREAGRQAASMPVSPLPGRHPGF